MKSFKRHLLLSGCLAFFITACGGGGNDNGPGPNDVTPTGDGPTVDIVNPIKRESGTSSLPLSGTAQDKERVVEVTWSNKTTGETGSADGTYDWSTVPIKLNPGKNTITVYASNPAGGQGQSSVTVTYVDNDQDAPTVVVESPQNNYDTTNETVGLSVSAKDNLEVVRVKWERTTAPAQEGEAVYNGERWDANNIPLITNTTNEIKVTAYDSAGNTAYATISVVQSSGNEVVLGYAAESCMNCHNGSNKDDYAVSDGLQNPHPFPGAPSIKCSDCHGGNPAHGNKAGAHIPPPPEMIFDPAVASPQNLKAWWNRVTLVGVDKFGDADGNYEAQVLNDAGELVTQTFNVKDYLRFLNPGDMRVVTSGKGCGNAGCHDSTHAQWASRNVIATETGIFSGAMYSAGLPNYFGNTNYEDTAADLAFRAIASKVPNNYVETPPRVGAVKELREYPVYSSAEDTAQLLYMQELLASDLNNDVYAAAQDPNKVNQIRPGSDLANMYHEQIAFTCGDCHAGSRGANNRVGDFRSSGCTACHMNYAIDGVTLMQDKIRNFLLDPTLVALDPNVNNEQIVYPQVPKVETHLIKNVDKKTIVGQFVQGIQDLSCAGCHQGSNRTVMQYWGIRLDQNQDVVNNRQYPANPANFTTTANDQRLYGYNNQRFNGRVAEQYLLTEDYDNDGYDDTPMDVHAEAGMGCIDCHGSRDMHAGTKGDSGSGEIMSRHEQTVGITCVSCHGNVDNYASTVECVTYDGEKAQCVKDRFGNPLRHVTKNNLNDYTLISRVNGISHYIPQTKDTVVNNGKVNKGANRRLGVNKQNQPIYTAKASFAMGRADGNPLTGIGPQQADPRLAAPDKKFSHTEKLDCVACHASWTNSCIGCHLTGEYRDPVANAADPRFSNITGDVIAYNENNAAFMYQTPVPFQLGITSQNMVAQFSPAEKVFYSYIDVNGDTSNVFAFSDRKGNGNNPTIVGANALPALGHNMMMAHSIRGRIEAKVVNGNNVLDEGPRYCVACHLTVDGLTVFGGGDLNAGIDAYNLFRQTIMPNLAANFAQLADPEVGNQFPLIANDDNLNTLYDLLQVHIGQNPSNQYNSPLWVHMVAGLGSGLYLFDQFGCPINGLDAVAPVNRNNTNCNDAPNANANAPVYDLDRVVEVIGRANASGTHPMQTGVPSQRRDGAKHPGLSGPLGGELIRRMSEPNLDNGGIVLDSYLDADGNPQGGAAVYIQ